jgi:hypothetical protein
MWNLSTIKSCNVPRMKRKTRKALKLIIHIHFSTQFFIPKTGMKYSKEKLNGALAFHESLNLYR